MPNWAQICTGLIFYAYAYVGIHQVRILVFDNYLTCPVPLTNGQFNRNSYWFWPLKCTPKCPALNQTLFIPTPLASSCPNPFLSPLSLPSKQNIKNCLCQCESKDASQLQWNISGDFPPRGHFVHQVNCFGMFCFVAILKIILSSMLHVGAYTFISNAETLV